MELVLDGLILTYHIGFHRKYATFDSKTGLGCTYKDDGWFVDEIMFFFYISGGWG